MSDSVQTDITKVAKAYPSAKEWLDTASGLVFRIYSKGYDKWFRCYVREIVGLVQNVVMIGVEPLKGDGEIEYFIMGEVNLVFDQSDQTDASAMTELRKSIASDLRRTDGGDGGSKCKNDKGDASLRMPTVTLDEFIGSMLGNGGSAGNPVTSSTQSAEKPRMSRRVADKKNDSTSKVPDGNSNGNDDDIANIDDMFDDIEADDGYGYNDVLDIRDFSLSDAEDENSSQTQPDDDGNDIDDETDTSSIENDADIDDSIDDAYDEDDVPQHDELSMDMESDAFVYDDDGAVDEDIIDYPDATSRQVGRNVFVITDDSSDDDEYADNATDDTYQHHDGIESSSDDFETTYSKLVNNAHNNETYQMILDYIHAYGEHDYSGETSAPDVAPVQEGYSPNTDKASSRKEANETGRKRSSRTSTRKNGTKEKGATGTNGKEPSDDAMTAPEPEPAQSKREQTKKSTTKKSATKKKTRRVSSSDKQSAIDAALGFTPSFNMEVRTSKMTVEGGTGDGTSAKASASSGKKAAKETTRAKKKAQEKKPPKQYDDVEADLDADIAESQKRYGSTYKKQPKHGDRYTKIVHFDDDDAQSDDDIVLSRTVSDDNEYDD